MRVHLCPNLEDKEYTTALTPPNIHVRPLLALQQYILLDCVAPWIIIFGLYLLGLLSIGRNTLFKRSILKPVWFLHPIGNTPSIIQSDACEMKAAGCEWQLFSLLIKSTKQYYMYYVCKFTHIWMNGLRRHLRLQVHAQHSPGALWGWVEPPCCASGNVLNERRTLPRNAGMASYRIRTGVLFDDEVTTRLRWKFIVVKGNEVAGGG